MAAAKAGESGVIQAVLDEFDASAVRADNEEMIIDLFEDCDMIRNNGGSGFAARGVVGVMTTLEATT